MRIPNLRFKRNNPYKRVLSNNQLPSVDKTRDEIAVSETKIIANNPDNPNTPITCSGTSFQCRVAGSGKTKITDVSTYPTKYDYLGTPMREGGMSGRSFQPDFILNWQNNSIATKYTKNSLKNTYGFENFQ